MRLFGEGKVLAIAEARTVATNPQIGSGLKWMFTRAELMRGEAGDALDSFSVTEGVEIHRVRPRSFAGRWERDAQATDPMG